MRLPPIATALSLATVAAVATPAAGAAGRVVLDDGHVDYAARLVDGRLQSRIKDSTTSGEVRWRRPSRVVFHVRPAAETTMPADGTLDFLGAPGDPVWVLPQTQRPDLLWPGWNTEKVSRRRVSGGVSWRLKRVRGPGEAAVFQVGSFGDVDVLFNSRDGLPDAHRIALGTHAHGAWAFTAQGRYTLTFELRATTRSGRRLRDTARLAVAVGDVDPAAR